MGEPGFSSNSASADGLAAAIERLEASDLDAAAARERATEFDVSVFHARWSALLAELGLADLIGPASDA